MLKFAFKSDVGSYRKNNEDIVWAGQNLRKETMVIACDGLGGHAGGEVASKLTMDVFTSRFRVASFQGMTQKAFLSWFNQTIKDARKQISHGVERMPELATMATTVTGAIVTDDGIYVFNCGDSRTYVVSGSSVRQVTVDHNVFNMLEQQKAPPETWERYRGRLHALTACVGALDENTPLSDVFLLPRAAADYVVSCTDGFSSFVKDESLAAVREAESLDAFVTQMIQLALSSHSNDNVSLAVVGLHEGA